MTGKPPAFPDDKTAPERRHDLTDEEIEKLDLAGGVEGGMQAGSAGGPSQAESEKTDGARGPGDRRRTE